MADDLPELLLPHAAAWRQWLEEHPGSPGVRLVLAKKGATEPTSITYGEALDEALCFGWIDGQIGRRDEATYRTRFTPRRAKSKWSKNNVENVARLTAAGRMRPAGIAAVESARADGRWEAAYAGAATIEIPPDLVVALDVNPQARAMFARLSAANRYAILYRLETAKRSDTRARRIQKYVQMLADGETIHPQ